MLYDMTAVALGAVFGALLRWLFSLMLADTVSWFALGTLAANWFGGFLIGVAAELVGNKDTKDPMQPALAPVADNGLSRQSDHVFRLFAGNRRYVAGAAVGCRSGYGVAALVRFPAVYCVGNLSCAVL